MPRRISLKSNTSWLIWMRDLPISDLPTSVSHALKNNYKKYLELCRTFRFLEKIEYQDDSFEFLYVSETFFLK